MSVPPNVPAPVAIAAVTTMPGTPFPEASFTWITGCWAKAAPLAALTEGCVVIVSDVGVPAVMFTMPEVTLIGPIAEKVSVRSPTSPVIMRLVNDARPAAVPVAVAVPPSVPPPDAMDAVTTTPATSLFDTSPT